MTTITVSASNVYDVKIGAGLLSAVGKELLALNQKPCRVCILSDDNVFPLYGKTVTDALEACGFTVSAHVIAHGEPSKCLPVYGEFLNMLATEHFSRTDWLIALGGGVVGDLCGFAAATYLRGVKYMQVPTTLLAMVDSSVGGKTGIDLAAGKNLACAFHQPSLVICDYSTLDTLPPEIFADGCAEVIKYGVINDRAFFDKLGDGIKNQIEYVIAECVKHKRDIVEEDEFETGRRKLLNLGHTVGHAVELCSSLEISHGSAVAIGMAIVMRSAVKQGLCPAGDLNALLALLGKEGLPIGCDYTAEQLAAVATADKKRSGNDITLVIPFSIGDTRLQKIPVSELRDFISKGL